MLSQKQQELELRQIALKAKMKPHNRVNPFRYEVVVMVKDIEVVDCNTWYHAVAFRGDLEYGYTLEQALKIQDRMVKARGKL